MEYFIPNFRTLVKSSLNIIAGKAFGWGFSRKVAVNALSGTTYYA
jgi:3-isopropylmalate dehydratase small subunit